VTIWQRPPQFGEGWTRGYVVIVPWTELRSWPEVETGEIEFARDPGHGHWVHIEIVFVDAGTTTRLVFDEEVYLLGSLTLVDGSEVKVIARKVRPTPDEAGRLAVAREEAIARMRQSPKEMIAEITDPKASVRIGGVRPAGGGHTLLCRPRTHATATGSGGHLHGSTCHSRCALSRASSVLALANNLAIAAAVSGNLRGSATVGCGGQTIRTTAGSSVLSPAGMSEGRTS
jgi:hypothetical protein